MSLTAAKPKGGRSWPCMRTEKQVMAGFPHLIILPAGLVGGLPDSAWNTDRDMAGNMTDKERNGQMTERKHQSYDIEGSDEEQH